MPKYGLSRYQKKNPARMNLAQLVASQLADASPYAKLTAANKAAVSRRTVTRRKGKARLLDLSKHGTVLGTGLESELAVAARWVGRDYIITRAKYLEPWRLWPADGPALSSFRAEWRGGSRFVSVGGINAIGFDFGRRPDTNWHPWLKPCIESVGIIRIVPKNGGRFFENDSMIHWGHHIRDGIYDTWAGCKFDKNGEPIWMGQDEDDDQQGGFIPCHYNQMKADGNGVAMVFRFREEFVAAMPKLLPEGGPKLLSTGS